MYGPRQLVVQTALVIFIQGCSQNTLPAFDTGTSGPVDAGLVDGTVSTTDGQAQETGTTDTGEVSPHCCSTRVCGLDPSCGVSCGSCATGACTSEGMCADAFDVRTPVDVVTGMDHYAVSSAALSANGSFLAVGAPGSSSGVGAAAIYRRNANSWDAGVLLDRPASSQVFGQAVAVSGDGTTVAVSYQSTPTMLGGVTIFQNFNGGFVATMSLPLPANASLYFGSALALSHDGNTLIVGDPGALGGNGAAVVYQNRTDGWTADADLMPPDERGFGYRVALSSDGTTIAASAKNYPSTSSGAVGIYLRSNGSWVSAPLLPTPTSAGRMGSGLALSRDGVLLLAGDPDGGSNGRGSLSLHRRMELGFGEGDAFVRPAGANSFGSTVAMSGTGNVAVAGDYHVVTVFVRAGDQWVERRLEAPGRAWNFGSTVVISSDGTTLVILNGGASTIPPREVINIYSL